MIDSLKPCRVIVAILMLLAFGAPVATADEIWVAPTVQQDTGGIGIGSKGVWPVTAVGAVRLAWTVPDNLQAFQSARVALIPHTPGGEGMLNLYVCATQDGAFTTADCSGLISQPFVGTPNQLVEVDVSAAIAPRVGTPGVTYLAIFAYTTPRTATDHLVGLRFGYRPMPLATAALADAAVTAAKIAPGTIDPSKLAFDPATQAELNAVAATRITSVDGLAGLTCTVNSAAGVTAMAVDADGRVTLTCVASGPATGSHLLLLSPGGVVETGAALFGPTEFDLLAAIVLAADGAGISTTDACETLTGNVAGMIVLVDRGNCNFVVKAQHVQAAGGIGMILADNNVNATTPPTLGGVDDTIVIGVLSITMSEGAALKSSLSTTTVTGHMVREATP